VGSPVRGDARVNRILPASTVTSGAGAGLGVDVSAVWSTSSKVVPPCPRPSRPDIASFAIAYAYAYAAIE